MRFPLLDFQAFTQLSPATFEIWNQIQKEKLEIYLTKMEIPLSQYFCYQPQLNSLWITMAMTQSTIERNGHQERKIKFDNGTFLDLTLNGITEAFRLSVDEMGDGFLIG